MGDESAAFEREDETRGDLVMPCAEGGGTGKAVECYIELNGSKYVAVVFEPLALRQVLRIEDAFPVLIAEAAASDPEFWHKAISRYEDSFLCD